MVRKKGPVWNHFEIISNTINSHPHVKCKYCSKEYKRAVPERMQTHLDKKCVQSPDSAKSQSKQQNTTSNLDHLSEEEKKSLKLLLSKVLSPYKLSNKEKRHLYVSDIDTLDMNSFSNIFSFLNTLKITYQIKIDLRNAT
ncbi:12744_t:CDS:2 [Rhizophagus irregularis]|nr:12744_t:CDS:2 [Rhizophagus irregularis]